MINMISTYGVYMGVDNGDGTYNMQRAPVQYNDTEAGLNGLHDYAQAIPNTVFLLIDEINEIIVTGTRWDGEYFYYAKESVGVSVSHLFHNHDINGGE